MTLQNDTDMPSAPAILTPDVQQEVWFLGHSSTSAPAGTRPQGTWRYSNIRVNAGPATNALIHPVSRQGPLLADDA
jgi:hypothetical protein